MLIYCMPLVTSNRFYMTVNTIGNLNKRNSKLNKIYYKKINKILSLPLDI